MTNKIKAKKKGVFQVGYSIFKFNALYLGNKIQPIPKQPVKDGFIPSYDGGTVISIGPAGEGKSITWIKPDGLNLLIADRVLLVKVSWEDLNKNGFVRGKPILTNGQYFRCRLLQVGENSDVPNEWDRTLDETSEDDALWHWNHMYFFGAELLKDDVSRCAIRGYHSACQCGYVLAANRYVDVGFRPALEPLLSDAPIPNINLDGIDFQLTSLPGGKGFSPILQPIQENVFKDIPVGGKVRMYTFTENGRPIHMDKPVKDPAMLTLTDRYYGDEFLIPWTISNGVAVVSQSLKQQI